MLLHGLSVVIASCALWAFLKNRNSDAIIALLFAILFEIWSQ